ncbi:MAG: dCTP deaminase [DPANN group archaeon]|nr:dCTP deaminase [DPANN group archaeon]
MLINNYKKKNIQGAAIELRLGSLYKQDKGTVDILEGKWPDAKEILIEEKPYTLKPGEFILGKTIESFDVPDDLAALVVPRSTIFRMGIESSTGFVDPGYQGELVVPMKNVGENPILLKHGMAVVKVIFLEVKGGTIPLFTRYMGGKVV